MLQKPGRPRSFKRLGFRMSEPKVLHCQNMCIYVITLIVICRYYQNQKGQTSWRVVCKHALSQSSFESFFQNFIHCFFLHRCSDNSEPWTIAIKSWMTVNSGFSSTGLHLVALRFGTLKYWYIKSPALSIFLPIPWIQTQRAKSAFIRRVQIICG